MRSLLTRQSRNVCATLLLSIFVVMGGCVKTERLVANRSSSLGMGISYAHLIFNPTITGYTPLGGPRSDWPQTIVSENPDEQLYYREIIHDYQGRGGFSSSGDQYNRRFSSERTGWSPR